MTLRRVPEPELMSAEEQARAYAGADFEEPHGNFIRLLQERLPGLPERGTALDLGCGPGDIGIRFARAFPAGTCTASTAPPPCWRSPARQSTPPASATASS